MSASVVALMASGGLPFTPRANGAWSATAADTTSPYSATVSISFLQDGTMLCSTTSGGDDVPADWVTPTGGVPGNFYWIEAHTNSGDAPSSGAVDSWLALTSTRTWSFTRASIGSNGGVWRFRIAQDSGGVIVVRTHTLTWSIENGPP